MFSTTWSLTSTNFSNIHIYPISDRSDPSLIWFALICFISFHFIFCFHFACLDSPDSSRKDNNRAEQLGYLENTTQNKTHRHTPTTPPHPYKRSHFWRYSNMKTDYTSENSINQSSSGRVFIQILANPHQKTRAKNKLF